MPLAPRQHRPYCASPAPQPIDLRRASASKRGYDRRWRAYRLVFLQAHPLCADCLQNGRYTPATEIDHVEAVTGPDDPGFWDEQNHRGLCKPCHSRKTCREDGGGFRRRGRS